MCTNWTKYTSNVDGSVQLTLILYILQLSDSLQAENNKLLVTAFMKIPEDLPYKRNWKNVIDNYKTWKEHDAICSF